MPTRNQFLLVLMLVAGIFDARSVAAPAGPTTMPADATNLPQAPATRPAGGASIKGRVRMGGGWLLQKPDLTRVVISLSADPILDAIPRTSGHVSVAQKNKTFVPNFSVVACGTDVEFPNWDAFDHNVFSRSKAAPAFDLDRYPRGQSKSRIFDKVGVVQVFCNIHPQMRAIIVVTANDFFARPNADGDFEISNVPPGRHEVVAWQERCGEQRQTIDLSPDKPLNITFTLEENRESVMANDPPRHGSAYGVERGLGIKRDRLGLPVVKDAHPAPDPEK